MVKPEEVLQYREPTTEFLCPLSANIYGIEFISFKIRDVEGKKTLFEVDRETGTGECEGGASAHTPAGVDPETAMRTIQYDFPRSFLKYKTIGTKLSFCVGEKAVPNFRMIERHYFRNKLIKSFDFTFGFCMPNSTNTWEGIYDLPQLSQAEEDEIVANSYETKSDSFYFVNDELVMHNKAEYSYSRSG